MKNNEHAMERAVQLMRLAEDTDDPRARDSLSRLAYNYVAMACELRLGFHKTMDYELVRVERTEPPAASLDPNKPAFEE